MYIFFQHIFVSLSPQHRHLRSKLWVVGMMQWVGQLRKVAVLLTLDIRAEIYSIFSKPYYDNIVGVWLHLENP